MAKYTKQDLKDAFLRSQGYQENVPDLDPLGNLQYDVNGDLLIIPNPESSADFISRKKNEWVRMLALDQLRSEEIDLARVRVDEDSDGVDL